jgi:multidrug resistance efflux pump
VKSPPTFAATLRAAEAAHRREINDYKAAQNLLMEIIDSLKADLEQARKALREAKHEN